MKQELYDKLSQLDRIEYLIKCSAILILFGLASLIVFGAFWIVAMILSDWVTLLTGIVLAIFGGVLMSNLLDRLETKFIERLEIKAKK